MRKFGNLDNFVMGMGLVAKPKQVLAAKYAALDGYGDTKKSGRTNLLIFAALVAIIYFLSPKGH